MAERNGAAMDIYLGRIPAEALVDRASLRRECLVGLDQVEIVDAPSRQLQRFLRGRDRARAHDRRVDADGGPGDDARQRLDAAFLGALGRHQNDCRGAVIDAGGIAGGDRAVLLESGPKSGQRFDRGVRLRMLVGIDHDLAFTGLDGDRHDLVGESARVHRRAGLPLRGHGEFILLFAGDLELLRDVLRSVAHVITVEGVPQAILDHRVDKAEVAHLLAVAQMRAVRRLAHALLAAGDDDIGIAQLDRLHAHRDGAQARPAKLVDLNGRRLHGNARFDRRLARRILAGSGG